MLLRKVLWLEGFPVSCLLPSFVFSWSWISSGRLSRARGMKPHVGLMLHSLLVMDSEGWEFFANICAWIYKGKIRVPTTGCPETGVTYMWWFQDACTR